jgi:hypothetical protein
MTKNMNMPSQKIRELESIIKQLKSLMEYTTSDFQEDRQLLKGLSYLSKALRTYNKGQQSINQLKMIVRDE